MYLVPGGSVYLVLGGVPGPRGCTWSKGVYLVWGGVPGPGGCVPGPGGVGDCTWLWGVYLVPGECTWSRGVSAPGPGDVRYSPPPLTE